MDFDKSINTPAPAQPEIPIVESKKELVENLSSQHHDPNPWPESLNNQIHFENPWAVEDGLEHFLYYCCPECDMKHPSREIFLQHAINHHPLSKECLHMLTGVKDENFLDDDYMDDDHIMDSADPIKYEDEDVKPLLSDLDPTQMLKVEQVDQAENGKSRGTNKPKRRRKCPHCNKISKNLAKHKCKIEKEDGEDDEPEQEYPCTHEGCEENFKSKATRTTHMNKVHGRPKTHKCDACEGMFESGRAVAKHYAEAHPGLKMKFPCSMCDKSYSSKMILKGHMKYVHQGIRFNCDQCGKEYHKRARLEKHVKIVHQGGEKIPCEICGKKFTDLACLKNHKIKIHIGDKVWQCDKCDQSFKYRNTFQMHVAKEHEGGLPYPCDTCDKAFIDQDKLNMHKKIVHEKRYDHFCEFCGKAFADIYRLKAHLGSVHGGKTPDFRSHDCAQCDAKFQYNYLLRQHVQAIHEGIKFQCPECGKEYNKRQTLNTHIKHVHDKIRNFACPFCSYCASQGCDLKKHIRRIHKVEYKAENKDLLRSPPTLLQPAQF